MMEQESNREKRFAFLENVKQYQVKSEEQVTDIEKYIQHLRLKYSEAKTKLGKEQNNKKVQACQRKLKRLGDILGKEAQRIATHFPDHVMIIMDELILLAKQHMNALTIQLIMNFLSAEVRCQSSSKQHQHEQSSKIHHQSSTSSPPPQVIALPPHQQSIIALPSTTHSLVICNANPSDICGQQLRQQSQRYFVQDDLRVGQYIEQRFVTVKRQGISEIFMNCAQKIVLQLIQPLVDDDDELVYQLTVDKLICCLKIISHISPSLYTYYLLSLLKSFSQTILHCFSPTTKPTNHQQANLQQCALATELQNKIKKSQYEQIVYLIKSLAERWIQHQGEFNVKVWEWKVEQQMILTFLSSTVSEKQLYSIKTLIDRIRKTQYNSYSAVNQQLLLEFIQSHYVIQKIFHPQNHPQVIIKGKQVFEFVVKNLSLTKQMIDLIFQLIIKSNQSLGKGLYQTLYSVGHQNLQANRQYILRRIHSLTRASLFYEETFNLIEALILFSPLENLRQSLQYTYMIIRAHYMALKAHTQHKLLNIYFEVYFMGVEEGVFGESQDDVMVCLKPFLQNTEDKHEDECELVFLMIDRFLQKLKEQLPKKLGHKCKYILNTAIKLLFSKYQIHKQSSDHLKNIIIDEPKQKQLRKNQLQLIKQLLESSEKQEIVNMLPQKQLWQLIQQDPEFGRFLSFYSKESQQFLLQKLLKKQNVTQGDVKNIIQVYQFMGVQMRKRVFAKIFELFLCTRDTIIKRKLVEFVVKEGQFSGEHLQKLVQDEMIVIEKQSIVVIDNIDVQFIPRVLGKLMLIKQCLAYNDNLEGYGCNPPFKYLTNSYSIRVKVMNMIDVLNPMTFQLQEQHYNTLRQCLLNILPIVGKRQLTSVSIKLDKAEKHVTLEQLNWRLNQLTVERQLSLTIQQGSQSSWYDQSLLINPKTNSLNQHITNALKQIFSHYTETNNQKTLNSNNSSQRARLFKNEACRIFAIATNASDISPHDARILHLFNNYSQTGEYLTVGQWINFYYQSALTNPQLVIDNLNNLGYADVFANVGNAMGTKVRNYTQMQEQQQVSNNRVRQYFANNQSIFMQLVQVSIFLGEMAQSNNNNFYNNNVIQQTLYLIVQLIKQLPTWKSLQEQVSNQFLLLCDQTNKQDISQINIKIKNKTQNFLLTYMRTCFVVNLIDDKHSVRCEQIYKKKVCRYCVDVAHILCNYLTEEVRQVINPLQLQCNEQLAIGALQNVNKVLLCGNSGIKQIQQVKVMLCKDITELTPFEIGKIGYLQHSTQTQTQMQMQLSLSPQISATQLFINQLSQLCAINADLVNTYCALILSQLMQSRQQKLCLLQQKGERQQLVKAKQFLVKLISYNGHGLPIIQDKINGNSRKQKQLSMDNQLQSLANKLVYLLVQNVQWLKSWFMGDLLQQTVKELITYNDCKRKRRHVGYFQTLSQLIILESDRQILAKVYLLLSRMIEYIATEKDHKYAQTHIYDHKQERNIFEIQQKLTQNILACLKNVILNMHYLGFLNSYNIDNIITLCQRLLIDHQLSPNSQSHCYQMLSTITLYASDKMDVTSTSFLNSILSTVTIKKNSKPNTTDNQSQCGIYNLGCICYINSIFQQLYHIDTFRQALMSTRNTVHQEKRIQQQQQLQLQEQPYFRQLRRIFYKLTYSHRQFITTEQFCQSYTDSNNQPINIKQQHDADEFLNQLLDRLQNTYQHIYHIPKHQTTINQLFQGTMSNVITCQNCLTNKVNQEEFYILSLEIKNMYTLKECLDKMVQPEVICDYFCTVCDKKVGEIQKYRKFSYLPKILFIHFQRLVFDLESFSKVKLENPVNFLQQIDLSQYFYQSLPNDQQAKYRLLGFIVHFGNSEGGHYISLIKQKGEVKGGWRKYDDPRITKWYWKTGIHEKDNAYLLIYEHIEPDTANIPDPSPTTMQDFSSTMQIQNHLLQQINVDNAQLNKQLTVTREQFCKFLISELQKQQLQQLPITTTQCYYTLATNSKSMQQQQLLQDREIQLLLRCKLIWKYLSIVEQAKHIGIAANDLLLPIMVTEHQLEKLSSLFVAFNSIPESAEYFLNIIVEQEALRLLYKPADKKLRQTYKWVMAHVVVQWARFREADEQQLSFLVPSLENQTIRKLLWQVENLLSEVGKSPNKMDEYFEFLLIIVKLVPKVKEYFGQMNIVPKLVHFIMQKESKLIKEIGHYYPLGTTGKKIQCFNVIIEIIGLYVGEYSEHILHDNKLRKCLGEQSIQFYKKLYSQRYQNYSQLNTILTICCHHNPPLTNIVITHLLTPNLNRFNHQDPYIVAYIDLMYMLLRIDDEEKEYRMYRMLGIPMLRDVLAGEEMIMIKRKGQRIVGYWSNVIVDSDEIMFPLLELLYTNRENINYFELTAIMCLLKLMIENNHICQYVMSLPSPCFAYENYLSWIRNDFLKSVIRQYPSVKLLKIELTQCINDIGRMLQEIDNKVVQGSIIGENETYFVDEKGWLERNSQYLLGEVTEKLETRLITVGVSMNGSLLNDDGSSILKIPLTYTILKTCHVTNWLKYAKDVCNYVEIIQPHEQYEDPKLKRKRLQALLKEKHCRYDISDSKLLQIQFSGDNQQLLPYRGTQSMLKVSFSYPQYPYQVLISVQKLINSQCKLIVPCPQKCKEVLNKECKDPYNDVDRLIEQAMSFQVVNSSRRREIVVEQMNQEHNKTERTEQKEHTHKDQEGQLQNKQAPITNQSSQTFVQAIAMTDAFIQSTENTSDSLNHTKDTRERQKKQEICIQCPFCGYIAHEFASRCPGCNEEWGLYA